MSILVPDGNHASFFKAYQPRGFMKYRVVLTSELFFTSHIQTLFRNAGASLTLNNDCKTEDDLIDAVRDADVVLTTSAPFSRKVFAMLPKLKGVVRIGIGVDNFDLQAATEKKIIICTVPNFYVEDVANQTLAFILACARRVTEFCREVRTGIWTQNTSKPLFRISESTIGLVGFGQIGLRVASRLKPFGPRILVFDPYLPFEDKSVSGFEIVDFERVIFDSDYVSIHCPLTQETRMLFDENVFQKMKNTAYLINTARGGIVNEDALVKALREGWIAGAAVDVFSKEPLSPDNPLLAFQNVILSPHIGWYSEESRHEAACKAAAEGIRLLHGQDPFSPVLH